MPKQRYTIDSAWQGGERAMIDGVLVEVQHADILDTRTGQRYAEGAWRVRVGGKACKRGTGGTLPFFGESAWSNAERLYRDIIFRAQRYGWEG